MSFSLLLETLGRPAASPRRQLASRYKNTLHTYQAVDVWSADGKKLLYAGFDDYARCDIIVRAGEHGEEAVVATTGSFDYHCAAWQHWALNDEAVVFFGQERREAPCPSLVRVDAPFQIEPLTDLEDCLIRQTTNKGNGMVFYRHPRQGVRLGLAGIYDLPTRTFTLRLDAEEVAAAVTSIERPDPGLTGFQHVVANPSGTRLFFKIDRRTPEGDAAGEASFLAFDMASRRIVDFGPGILGHPSWLDDRYIVNIQGTRDGSNYRYLVAMDTEDGSVHRLLDTPITGPGHPCASPDGRWLVSDAFTANHETVIIYLLDLRTGVVREIDRFAHSGKISATSPGYNPHVITRAHPHPVWSPDSRTILANNNFGGERLGIVLWDLKE